MSGIPTLLTARLQLRPFADSDASTVERLAGDLRIAATTATIPHPYPPGTAAAWIVTHEAAWNLGRGLTLAIVERDGGTVVGAVGLNITPEHRSAELGYWIGAEVWGRGIATEAARALVDHGFGALDLHRVHAHHFARNTASGRVLEKVGMRPEGLRREAFLKWERFEDVREWGMLRSDWRTVRRAHADT
ncbi:GNAT family protein [Opitutales bacterium ASA1]|uniref:GNAT family N-acetyltransferase n=1 Tax=Congregicoccus parvus TaxID=3081749 RepID=UPI002B2E4DFF|nr:GNAT family protein [Opitutales bacterium ASA1]